MEVGLAEEAETHPVVIERRTLVLATDTCGACLFRSLAPRLVVLQHAGILGAAEFDHRHLIAEVGDVFRDPDVLQGVIRGMLDGADGGPESPVALSRPATDVAE